MRKNKYVQLLAIAALIALSACSNNNDNDGTNTNNPSPSAPSGETKEITVDAKNFQFTPSDIQLHAGDTVKLTLQNSDGVHGLEIPDLNVNIKNGETATFTVDKAGNYDFNCSIQCGAGHDNMTGTLTVS
jgi:Heme/copper-type cytochrome/quinol oxidases, subunit 2